MRKSKKAFSLIEVITATVILTIAVFGVYKLVGENSKLINNSNNYTKLVLLKPTLEQCINNLGFDNFKASSIIDYDFHFGNDNLGCFTGSTSSGVIIDNLSYELSGNITNSGAEFIDWELKMFGAGIGSFTGVYKQEK